MTGELLFRARDPRETASSSRWTRGRLSPSRRWARGWPVSTDEGKARDWRSAWPRTAN